MSSLIDRFYIYDPHPSKSSEGLRFLCPKCGDDKPRDKAHKSLALNKATGMFLCHRCGYTGCVTKENTIQKPVKKVERSLVLQRPPSLSKPLDLPELFPIINTPCREVSPK